MHVSDVALDHFLNERLVFFPSNISAEGSAQAVHVIHPSTVPSRYNLLLARDLLPVTTHTQLDMSYRFHADNFAIAELYSTLWFTWPVSVALQTGCQSAQAHLYCAYKLLHSRLTGKSMKGINCMLTLSCEVSCPAGSSVDPKLVIVQHTKPYLSKVAPSLTDSSK